MAHGAGTFTNTATACGELIIDSGPLPKVCDEDDETVDVHAAAGRPAGRAAGRTRRRPP